MKIAKISDAVDDYVEFNENRDKEETRRANIAKLEAEWADARQKLDIEKRMKIQDLEEEFQKKLEILNSEYKKKHDLLVA